MSWYNNSKDYWRKAIQAVASEKHRNRQMVEKDVVQSFFLSEISKNNSSLVFKGGTSLSKAFLLIDRFSEDIDLSADHKLTEAERKTIYQLITRTAEKMGFVLLNEENVQPRYTYNKYIFKYPSVFEDNQEIIIETNFYQISFPIETKEIHSLVGDFYEETGTAIPAQAKVLKFNMKVQTLERTFVEKVFAICDYRIQNMQERDSRHLYDIAKLIDEAKMDESFAELINKVRQERAKYQNHPSAKKEINITKMLEEIIKSEFYKQDYEVITSRLLYEEYSYNQAIDNGIAKLVALHIF